MNRTALLGAAVLAAPVFLFIGAFSGFIAYNTVAQITASQWLWAVCIYPVSEEIIFRGGIQRVLARWLRVRAFLPGVSVPNFLTSLLFTAAHLWTQGSLLVLAVFLPSMIFGLSYEVSGKLMIPIALHSWYNLIGMLWVWTATVPF